MRIYEIKQIKGGRQERPYADHIYEWSIWGQFPNGEEEILQFCKTYLHDAKHEEKEYFKLYRDNSLSFSEKMELICGGRYRLTRNEQTNDWTYVVHEEYIH